MKKKKAIREIQEPLGIIISRADPAEEPTIFRAYIWAAAPDMAAETEPRAA